MEPSELEMKKQRVLVEIETLALEWGETDNNDRCRLRCEGGHWETEPDGINSQFVHAAECPFRLVKEIEQLRTGGRA